MIVLDTLGQKMADAGLNSLVCIGVVFCVLIFISLIISLFQLIPKAENAIARKKEAKNKEKAIGSEAVDNAVSQLEAKEELVLEDEFELVAVISAAIAASAGTSADGFVVRSIRKIRR